MKFKLKHCDSKMLVKNIYFQKYIQYSFFINVTKSTVRLPGSLKTNKESAKVIVLKASERNYCFKDT